MTDPENSSLVSCNRPQPSRHGVIWALAWLRLLAARFGVRDRRGVTSLFVAVSMTTLVGLIGMGTEVGGWYLEKRHGQNAADAAAWAGAAMLAYGQSFSAAKTAATNEATKNGFTKGGNITVTVNPYQNNNSAVEVIVSQTQPTLLAGAFIPTVTVNNRAAVGPGASGGNNCVLALGSGGLQMGGNSTDTAPACGL